MTALPFDFFLSLFKWDDDGSYGKEIAEEHSRKKKELAWRERLQEELSEIAGHFKMAAVGTYDYGDPTTSEDDEGDDDGEDDGRDDDDDNESRVDIAPPGWHHDQEDSEMSEDEPHGPHGAVADAMSDSGDEYHSGDDSYY